MSNFLDLFNGKSIAINVNLERVSLIVFSTFLQLRKEIAPAVYSICVPQPKLLSCCRRNDVTRWSRSIWLPSVRHSVKIM